MSRPPSPRRALVPAELLLAGLTVVAAASFGRLFEDSASVAPLVVLAVLAHVVAAAVRRRGLGTASSLAASVGGAVLGTSVALYPHTSFLGLPTPTSFRAAGADLDAAWVLFQDVVAPAPASRGFLLASALALWAGAGLADWAAFRLRAVAEPVLPALALFTFTALLGRGPGGVLGATAFAALVLGFAVAQRTARTALDDTWVGGHVRPGAAALARVGALGVLAVALVAGVVAPRVPGASEEALVDWRAGNRAENRMTVSPLVDIRSRLVNQSDTVVFTVEADRPAYWRLTSLDRFDGQLWSSSESFSRAEGSLPGPTSEAPVEPLEQTFSIEALGTIWAPAALRPVALDGSTTELRWNASLATLIVPASEPSIDRARYRVLSEAPTLTPDLLRRPRPDPLPEDLVASTALPRGLSPEVAAIAADVVADAGPTPYDQALALQDWFRSEFTYDLDGVPAGHDDDAIMSFLQARQGYCEQFAGTFAAMARTLGLPARVAVGFTPGELGDDGRTYTVRGRNAHAWPEVHIDGIGWVPFEPTPGRGQPGTESYTGVAPAQDDADGTPRQPTTTTTTTAPPTESPGTDAGPTTTAPEVDERADAPLPPPSSPSGGGGPPLIARVALALLAAAVAVVVLDVGLLALLRARRRRRRAAATTVAARVAAAWAEALDALARAGILRMPAETDVEFARRAARSTGPAGEPLRRLASLATAALWAPGTGPADPEVASEADALAGRVAEEARRRRSTAQHLRHLLDPRLELRPR